MVGQKHSGAVQVRGMIRRIWRPRYLDLDDDGVLRYYEAAVPEPLPTRTESRRRIRNRTRTSNSNRDIRMSELQAFSLPHMRKVENERGQEKSAGNAENKRAVEHNATNTDHTDDEDGVHVPKVMRKCDNSDEVGGQNDNDPVIVEKLQKTLSKDSFSMDKSSKSGSWDDINMITSSPSSSTFGEATDEPEKEWSKAQRKVKGKTKAEAEAITGKNIEVMLHSKVQSDLSLDVLVDNIPEPTAPVHKQTLHHQIHDHRPKAVMTILSARLIDVSSLRDVHVGLPKGTHGFVFCGRQMFSERDSNCHDVGKRYAYGQEQSFGGNHGSGYYAGETGSISGDHFEIRDDICHPLSILNVSDQYFDTSRDYLCSVGTKEEAKAWVKALKWAASKSGKRNRGTKVGSRSSGSRRSSGASRRESSRLEGNEISIRPSFHDAGRSPLGSPLASPSRMKKSCSGLMDDLAYQYEQETAGQKDLMESLLSDTSSTITDPNVSEGYTVVAKIKQFKVQRTAWKRLVGIKCCTIFEIQLLLLNMNHLMHRSKRNEGGRDNGGSASLWKVEQRTVFRTYNEVLALLASITDTKGVSGSMALLKILNGMKDSRHERIFPPSQLDKEIGKAVEKVDGALREITSHPELCDTTIVKHFLGLLDGSKWNNTLHNFVPRKDTLNVCTEDSVDDFVRKWLLAQADEILTLERVRNYVLLMLNNTIVEVGITAIVMLGIRYFMTSCWSTPLILTLNFESLIFLLCAAYHFGESMGSPRIETRVEHTFQTEAIRKKKKRRSSTTKTTKIAPIDDDTVDNDSLGLFETGSNSDDSHLFLSSPLPIYSENEFKSCWSRPSDTIFSVRSKTYFKNKVKLPSGPSPFQCRGADMWLTNNPERNISRLPCVLGGKLGEEDTFLVNFLLPFGNFVMYFTIPKDMPQNVANIWNKFKNGDQIYRDARLKLLPVVIDGPWIVKKAVGPGTAPALLSQSIPLQYYFTPGSGTKKGIYEIDVIITASRIAKGILGVVKNHTKRLSIALSFIIEATTEAELPETVLGSCQLHSLDLELCPQLPKYFLDESPNGSYEEDS